MVRGIQDGAQLRCVLRACPPACLPACLANPLPAPLCALSLAAPAQRHQPVLAHRPDCGDGQQGRCGDPVQVDSRKDGCMGVAASRDRFITAKSMTVPATDCRPTHGPLHADLATFAPPCCLAAGARVRT